MKFTIASGVVATLTDEAAAGHPREACGLLIGRGRTVTRAEPARNVAARPDTGFEIDPATLLRVHREVRVTGEAVVGHYHSHPNGAVAPSRTDTARAVEDGQLWVIVADGAATGWTFVAGAFVAVELA